MRAVNLLPEDAQQHRLRPPVAPTVGVAACVLAVGAVGAVAQVESRAVADHQRQLDALKLKLARVPAPKQSTATEAIALLNTRGQRIAALNAAIANRVAYDRVLRQLSLVLPGDVWLDSLQLSTPSSSAAAAATAPSTSPDVTITGYTYTAEGVARLLQRIGVTPTLSDIALVNAQVQQHGTKNLFHFTISANLVQPGGTP